MRLKIGKVAKAVVAAVGALCTALAPLVADDVIVLDELGPLGTALVTAVATVYGVWRVPNREPDPHSDG